MDRNTAMEPQVFTKTSPLQGAVIKSSARNFHQSATYFCSWDTSYPSELQWESYSDIKWSNNPMKYRHFISPHETRKWTKWCTLMCAHI